MFSRLRATCSTFLFILLSACGLAKCAPDPLNDADIDALYAKPLAAPEGPMAVYHVGHSLVGRDMPAMLAQLAGTGHSYESQLGWGAPLAAHWEPDVEVNGFDVENAHPRYRDAHEAVDSGEYDALILTEAVEIRDMIKYNDSWDYLARWAKAAWSANPDTRVYFYETWHPIDDPEGWLFRLDRDLEKYWEGEILDRALNADGVDRPIYVIPGGQVMARLARELEASGGVTGLRSYKDLFSDNIHFNDVGAYLIALTHYAVLYQRDPTGLPHELLKSDGSPAQAPTPEAAALMQRVVWEVATGYPRTMVHAE